MAVVITKGLTETATAIKTIAVKLDAAAKVIVTQSAALIEAEAKKNFVGSHKKGAPHVGGDRPNVVTGNLRRSITHDPVTRDGIGAWRTAVGPTAVYGRRVELGYTGGGSGRGHQATRPFPFLKPAVDGAEMQLTAIGLAGWARVLG